MLILLSTLLYLSPGLLGEYCYPQFCYESDGFTYITCDHEYNTCYPGDWLSYASCAFSQVGDASGAAWCQDYETCRHDWSNGEPFCSYGPATTVHWMDSYTAWNKLDEDWNHTVNAGLSIFYTIIIVAAVMVVVLILLCVLCCYCCGKGCCKKRAANQNVVIQNAVHPNGQQPLYVSGAYPGAQPNQAAYPGAQPNQAAYPGVIGTGGVYFNQSGQPYPPAPVLPATQVPVPMSYNQPPKPPTYTAEKQ